MKFLKTSLLLGAVFFSVSGIAQTAEEILEKHIEAIGGKEKLSAIKSVHMDNTMQVMGNDAPSSTVILNGKGFRNESDFNGQKIVQVYTDKGGWSINPFTGSTDPQPLPEQQYKASRDQIYAVRFLDFATRGGKAELAGREKVGEVEAYKVKVTSGDQSAHYFFDPTTYYLLKTVATADMQGQQVEVVTTFSDHKKIEYGWVMPHSMDIDFGGQFQMVAKVNKVTVNQPVDEKVFEMK